MVSEKICHNAGHIGTVQLFGFGWQCMVILLLLLLLLPIPLLLVFVSPVYFSRDYSRLGLVSRTCSKEEPLR